MTTQQIQYFICSAKNLSFTKAAEELFSSQPTVSRQIALLEQELGFPLFYREGKQLRLTSAGLVMLSEFTRQQDALQKALEQIHQINSGYSGSLKIGFLTTLDTDYYVLPPSQTFSQRYPNITIAFEGASFTGLRQRLDSGEYDVIFTYSFELPYMPDVLSQPVYQTGCCLFVSSHHPLAQKDHLTADDLRGQTLIFPKSFSSEGWAVEIFDILKEGFQLTASDFASMHTRIVDTLETKEFLIRAGQGIGVTGSCASFAYDNRYTLFPIPNETLEIHAMWRKDNLNAAIPLYLQVLSDTPEIDVFTT